MKKPLRHQRNLLPLILFILHPTIAIATAQIKINKAIEEDTEIKNIKAMNILNPYEIDSYDNNYKLVIKLLDNLPPDMTGISLTEGFGFEKEISLYDVGSILKNMRNDLKEGSPEKVKSAVLVYGLLSASCSKPLMRKVMQAYLFDYFSSKLLSLGNNYLPDKAKKHVRSILELFIL